MHHQGHSRKSGMERGLTSIEKYRAWQKFYVDVKKEIISKKLKYVEAQIYYQKRVQEFKSELNQVRIRA